MPTDIDSPIKIMMVAGEHSGDILAAGLIKQLKKRYPQASFTGIGGPRMMEEGFESLYPMSKLSVFGLFEVIKHLPELLMIRWQLKKHLIQQRPDVFIGIDAPDFNLKLERDLHQKGIKTVHYVSPTVWAWRPKRIKKLIGSLNALLCIFPFEERYFANTQVPAYFVGHPLADQFKVILSTESARNKLDMAPDECVLTLMPGSRLGEINRHSLLFIKAAQRCANKIPGLKILVPMADQACKNVFEKIYIESGIKLDLTVKILDSKIMISASNYVLTASGTATLEVLLAKKPMVVAYKLSPLTAWVITTFQLLKTPFVSMPNLIANKAVVKEFLLDKATDTALADELIQLHQQPARVNAMVSEFMVMKDDLTRDADTQAAKIVSTLIEGTV
jgi:lipid-A-disaccharide synthase